MQICRGLELNAWHIIAIVLLAAALYPFAVFAIKRMVFIRAVKKSCKKSGLTLTPLRRGWLFRSGSCPGFDLAVKTAGQTYNIKLIGAVWRHTRFYFTDRTHMIIRRYFPCGPFVHLTNFSEKVCTLCNEKEDTPSVIVIYPRALSYSYKAELSTCVYEQETALPFDFCDRRIMGRTSFLKMLDETL